MKKQLAIVLLILSSFFVVHQSNADQQPIYTTTGSIQPQAINGTRSPLWANFTASVNSFRFQTYYQFIGKFQLTITGLSNSSQKLSLNTITFFVCNGSLGSTSTVQIATFTALQYQSLVNSSSTTAQLAFYGPDTKVPPVLSEFYYLYFHVDRSYILVNESNWNTVYSSTYLFKIPVPNSTANFVTTSSASYHGYSGTSELIGFAQLFLVMVAPFVIGYVIIKKYKH